MRLPSFRPAEFTRELHNVLQIQQDYPRHLGLSRTDQRAPETSAARYGTCRVWGVWHALTLRFNWQAQPASCWLADQAVNASLALCVRSASPFSPEGADRPLPEKMTTLRQPAAAASSFASSASALREPLPVLQGIRSP